MTEATNPFLAGLMGKCPACGKGSLFSGYLKFADRCSACGEDFAKADAGDGPAVFVIFVAGAIIIPLVLAIELALTPPLWVHMVVWLPLTTGAHPGAAAAVQSDACSRSSTIMTRMKRGWTSRALRPSRRSPRARSSG
jgi:uncharacterized protein (DUF983 family)